MTFHEVLAKAGIVSQEAYTELNRWAFLPNPTYYPQAMTLEEFMIKLAMCFEKTPTNVDIRANFNNTCKHMWLHLVGAPPQDLEVGRLGVSYIFPWPTVAEEEVAGVADKLLEKGAYLSFFREEGSIAAKVLPDKIVFKKVKMLQCNRDTLFLVCFPVTEKICSQS